MPLVLLTMAIIGLGITFASTNSQIIISFLGSIFMGIIAFTLVVLKYYCDDLPSKYHRNKIFRQSNEYFIYTKYIYHANRYPSIHLSFSKRSEWRGDIHIWRRNPPNIYNYNVT